MCSSHPSNEEFEESRSASTRMQLQSTFGATPQPQQEQKCDVDHILRILPTTKTLLVQVPCAGSKQTSQQTALLNRVLGSLRRQVCRGTRVAAGASGATSSNSIIALARKYPSSYFPSLTRPVTTRAVAGLCSICLANYSVGEEVTWSANALCQHVFHRECISLWLANKRRSNQCCPCCRQIMTVKEFKSVS
jgi:hypothetical protein